MFAKKKKKCISNLLINIVRHAVLHKIRIIIIRYITEELVRRHVSIGL